MSESKRRLPELAAECERLKKQLTDEREARTREGVQGKIIKSALFNILAEIEDGQTVAPGSNPYMAGVDAFNWREGVTRADRLERVAEAATKVVILFNRYQSKHAASNPEERQKSSHEINRAIIDLQAAALELQASDRMPLMDPRMTPWDGNPGYLCLPRKENIPEPRPDWKLVECPKCGSECYLAPDAKKAIEDAQGKLQGYCTTCALKSGKKGA